MNHRPVPSLQPTQKATSRDRMAKDGQEISGWIVPLPRSPGGEISTRKREVKREVDVTGHQGKQSDSVGQLKGYLIEFAGHGRSRRDYKG